VSVTAAAGFRAAGVAAGLKSTGAPDVAVVVNDGPLDVAAGVFTTNRVQAAPVLWSRQVLTSKALRAVVLNSGGANACTGSDGFADTHRTAEYLADRLKIGAGEIAVCSTGLIGLRLPMDNLLAGVDKAVAGLDSAGGPTAAEAIRTTDSMAKMAEVTVQTTGGSFIVGGMIKGAGMLAPSLATMLCVVTTDAVTDAGIADRALRAATRRTLERVDSDGCLSTNDTVLLLASGASGATPDEATLTAAVTEVCGQLAALILADAEGSTKTIAIEVVRAENEDDAVEVGRAVARNNLLKCALYGEDANWGRVLAAVGTTAAAFEADQLDVAINGIQVCRSGGVGEDRELVDLSGRDIRIVVDLHAGEATATVWTNDLTNEYVHENSAYST
jgi:glutamate N-acetyltransferase/amino-acid N-acetyltransferase